MSTHGTADGTIPYKGRDSDNGDTAYALPDIDAWRLAWVERNGCQKDASTVVTQPYTNTTETAWNACGPVVGFTIKGMGHTWVTTSPFNAAKDQMIPFFQAHSL